MMTHALIPLASCLFPTSPSHPPRDALPSSPLDCPPAGTPPSPPLPPNCQNITLSPRPPQGLVFAGAIAALILMTVISTALGVVVPSLISPSLTRKAATVLYLIFGVRLLWIAYKSEGEDVDEEIHEVPIELHSAAPVSCRHPRIWLQRHPLPVVAWTAGSMPRALVASGAGLDVDLSVAESTS